MYGILRFRRALQTPIIQKLQTTVELIVSTGEQLHLIED